MGRRSILAIVAAVAVLSAAVGWVAGQRIKSPGQIAAEQEPPEPSLITVPVEFRTLSQDVIVRGTIRLSDQTPLEVSSTEGSSVITRLVKDVGDTIEEGDVLIEVAGRPVIALEGPLPAFRNLIPGLEGPDVEQLERALSRLGYSPGNVDGVYTADTSAAVAELYRDRGYPAPEPDAGLQASLDGAEAEVEARQDALDDANAALGEAGGTVTDVDRRQLDLAIERAKADLATAQADAATAKDAAAHAIVTAERELAAAQTEAATAADRLAQAEAGTHPDTNAPPTPQELAALEAAAADAADAVGVAESALSQAKAAQPRIATDQDLLVKGAELSVAEAEQIKSQRLAPGDLSPLRNAVSQASTALGEARAGLAEARAEAGAWIPTVEVQFLSSTPRQVASLDVELGDQPTGSVMTISGAETVIDSGVSSADRSLIEVGGQALLEDDDLGLSIEAVVSFVADSPGGPGLSEDRYAMRLEPVGDLPEEAIGLNLRISIPITSSGGDVMAVPLAALSAGADGTARVEVERSVGETELVEVSTGLRAEGFVQIEPLGGASLEPGDRVVVGRDLELPGSDAGDSSSSEADDGGDA